MRYSSKFLRSRCCPHTGKLLTKPFRVRRRARTRQTAPARTLMMKNRFAFGSTDMHANGLVSYAFDAKITTKQALGEAATVRCDVRPQRLDVNFTLGQRVKLRLSESINAALEFRA